MRSSWRSFNKRKVLALALIVLIMNPRQVFAADGDLDTTFGLAGKVTTDIRGSAGAVAVQSDGKIVAGGSGCERPSRCFFAIARYNRDGSLDATFGSGGRVTTDFNPSRNEGWVVYVEEFITALAIQPDGKIVAAGIFLEETRLDNYDYGLLARYNSDGSLDPTFGIGGKLITDFLYRAIDLQTDGKIITAGHAYIFTPGSSRYYGFALGRYNIDGSPDPSFGLNGKVTTTFTDLNEAFAVAIQPDGKIVAAGATGPLSRSASHFALARYNIDGSLDSGFGVAGKVTTEFTAYRNHAYAVAIQSDGKIVAAGFAEVYQELDFDFALARYNSDGSLDPTFALGGKVTTDFAGSDIAYDVAVQFDGKIIAAGGNGAHFALARYNNDGSLDGAFGVGGKVTTDFSGRLDFAKAIAVQPDGKIVAAGGGDEFTTFALARYENSPPPVTSLTFDPTVVRPGESFSVVFAGPSLTDTYFDIRFRSPGSSSDQVALNWQQGASGRHTVAIGTDPGTWTVTGVRAHRDANDHAGDFVAIVSTVTVTEVRLGLGID